MAKVVCIQRRFMMLALFRKSFANKNCFGRKFEKDFREEYKHNIEHHERSSQPQLLTRNFRSIPIQYHTVM